MAAAVVQPGGGESVVDPLIRANKQWQAQFDKPLPLGVKRRLVIITCECSGKDEGMDSRLIPELFLGLEIGDAEVIRNAGGRVTPDVFRSLLVCQDILSCSNIVIIHHTDCGGQVVAREKDKMLVRLEDHLLGGSFLLRTVRKVGDMLAGLIPTSIKDKVTNKVLMPVYDLPQSVVDDMRALRDSPLIAAHVGIYGYIYDTTTGKLEEVKRDPGAITHHADQQ